MLKTIATNAILGDGYIRELATMADVHFQSKNIDWLTFKRDLCIQSGLSVGTIRTQKSGYTGRNDIYIFDSRGSIELLSYAQKTIENVIQELTKTELVMWYLDDGSYHIKRNTMHLYSSSLTIEQNELLIQRIQFLYNQPARLRIDKKKDGRQYPYLYFGRRLVELFRVDVEHFINKHDIESLRYKAGEPKPLRETFNDYPYAYKKHTTE